VFSTALSAGAFYPALVADRNSSMTAMRSIFLASHHVVKEFVKIRAEGRALPRDRVKTLSRASELLPEDAVTNHNGFQRPFVKGGVNVADFDPAKHTVIPTQEHALIFVRKLEDKRANFFALAAFPCA
jgi:hypothetical protein